MEKKKTFYEKTKVGIRAVVQVYCFLGAIYCFGMTVSGSTTGHLSSDIYTGRHRPTKIEKILCEKVFGINLETRENGKK